MDSRQSPSLTTLARRAWRGGIGLALASTVALLALAGCGTTTTTGGGGNTTGANCPSAETQASWHLVSPGKLTIASDTTYAPAEYEDPANPGTYIGYDIDIAKALAKQMCLTAVIQKADFTTIISDVSGPALGTQRYDMSISSFTINDTRQQKVDMIPYFTAGESLLIPAGSNAGLTSDFTSMCGKTIAAQDGTVEIGELQDANGTGDGTSGQAAVCKSNAIKILHYADQTVVVQQVVNGSAQASYQDSPVTGFYAEQSNGKLTVGPVTVPPSPEGIVVRKDNKPFEDAVTAALAAIRADGTYKNILSHWGQLDGAYPPLS
ncbi:MAG TPA: ABC transporter substrate-binding protein [Ktedonobacterales bacterium]|nr:ABC transporter substrate-binding protein [Ktedonobacterales bacterium]